MDLTFTGSPTRIVTVEDESQIGQARRVAQVAATEVGFDATDAGRVALVATELATNVFKHGRGGEIHVARVPGSGTMGVEVIAVDRGPGFNLADCLPDGFSTSGTRGEGLGAVSRQVDVLDMYADHRGAVVLARLYPKGFRDSDIRFGAVQQAIHGERVCGDGWAMAMEEQTVSLLLIDGLGHGPSAHEAAQAGTTAFVANTGEQPVAMMHTLHDAMTRTRGGAAAVARYERDGDRLRYAGIGNIAGHLLALEGSRGLASHPGIVGVQSRRVQPFDFPLAGGKLLLMYSDGLQTRWDIRDYPGLARRHPAVVTALLYRDYNRGRDDITIVAIALGTVP